MRIKIIVLYIIMCCLVMEAKAIDLKYNGEIPYPQLFEIDPNTLFLVSGSHLLKFDLPSCQFKRRLGSSGEGPGEFIRIDRDRGMVLTIETGRIVVNSRHKISAFSRAGMLLSETKTRNGSFFRQVGQNFVGIHSSLIDQIRYHSVCLYDWNFKIIRRFHKEPHWYQPNQSINPIKVSLPHFRVINGKIFILNQAGQISVYTQMGDPCAKTSFPFPVRKIKQKDREGYHEYYKSHPIYKNHYHALKDRIRFPESFPPVKYFDVDEKYIYVVSFQKREGKAIIYLFRHSGECMGKGVADLPEQIWFEPYPLIRIYKQQWMVLSENPETENIQLKWIPIEGLRNERQ